MQNENEPTKLGLGIIIALIAYLFFVTASSLVRTFGPNFPIVQIIFIQNFICLLCMIPLWFIKPYPGIKSNIISIHMVRSLSGALSYYLYFVTIRFLNLVDATLLNYTGPFFVPLIWWIWMRERVGRNVWCSIILGFIGIAIILRPTKELLQLGFVLGIFAGILMAIALCAIRVLHRRQESMRWILTNFFLIGSIVSFPFALVFWTTPSAIEWFKAILIGIATVCGQMLLTLAYRYGTASYLSPLGYSAVIYAGIFTYFIFGEPLSIRTLLGAILIILGGSTTYILKKKPKTVKETFKRNDKDKDLPR